MISNIWFKIIAGEINKILEFYTIFARKKCPINYIIKQRDRGQAEAKTSRPRPRPKFWPRGLNITANSTTTMLFLYLLLARQST